jgi:hypothetical protein
MTTDELLDEVIGFLDLESRDELEHVAGCEDCYLEEGCLYKCRDFQMVFKGYQPATVQTREEWERSQTFMGWWATEVMYQAMPVLRFEQFAAKDQAQ